MKVFSGNLPASRRGESEAGDFITKKQDFSSASGIFLKPCRELVLVRLDYAGCFVYIILLKTQSDLPSIGFIIPILQMNKLRLREIIQFVQCHSQ